MTIGPGKYDDLCTLVREKSGATSAVVIVFGGVRGHGFSCQLDQLAQAALPEVLERIAQQIRNDTK